jgi:small GTP-binding protein
MTEQKKELLKFVLVGDSSVGKTSIAMEFFNPKSSKQNSYIPTSHFNFQNSVVINGTSIITSVFDTNINEYDQCAPEKLFPKTNFFILCFDINDKRSFENIKKLFCSQVDSYGPPDSIKILVGTKKDAAKNDSISNLEAKQLAKEINAIEYLETSAHEHLNIDEIFENCVKFSLKTNQKKECVIC